ncbi:MAG: WecB/TagA/CpsF family glycosyltransferase, partial [Chloroflexia bacterium]|nr:WecB/TagA/CpsF family glycosyltransferase [Chloroflexia bacterium]
MVIEAYKDPAFRYIVNNSSYTVADGVPILKSLQFLYGIEQERIAGMDFMPLLIEKAALENVPIYFYGSDKDILDLVKNKALKENPGLIIAGMFSPPFRILTQTEQSDIVDKINLSGALHSFRFVWVVQSRKNGC